MAKINNVYSNNARTTLNGSITSTASTIVVTSAATFPAATTGQQFFITLDDGTNSEIVKVASVAGNTFSGCVRGQDGTTGTVFASGTIVSHRVVAQNMRELARLDDHMSFLTDITYLANPATMNGDSYICAGVTAEGAPNIALSTNTSGGNCWTFVSYPAVAYSGYAPVGCTTTRVPFTGANTTFVDALPKAYILQFITGAQRGVSRFISSVDSTGINFTPAIPSAAASGDAIAVYQYIGKNVYTRLSTIDTHLSTLDSTTAAHTGQISTLNSTVSTNTANIATNTTNIATNTASIASLSSSKANLNSPGLTGIPTSPTPAASDNSTKIATTAFVNNIFSANENLASNGELQLPGGFQMKWATVTVSGSGTSYTWASLGITDFNTACFGITANSNHSTGPMDIVSYSASGFTLDNNGDDGSCSVCVWSWGH